MTEDHFARCVEHFTAHAKPSKETPAVLLLDNHDLHFPIQAIRQCKQNGVAVLIFPPPCSHKLRPCDRSVKGSLTTYVNRAYDACVTKHPGTVMTIHDTPCAVNTTLNQTSFPDNTKTDFQVLEFTLSAGIFSKLILYGNLGCRLSYLSKRAAVSSSNSKLPTFLMILPNNRHLLQK